MLRVLEPLHAERHIVAMLGGHLQALQGLSLLLLHLLLLLLPRAAGAAFEGLLHPPLEGGLPSAEGAAAVRG